MTADQEPTEVRVTTHVDPKQIADEVAWARVTASPMTADSLNDEELDDFVARARALRDMDALLDRVRENEAAAKKTGIEMKQLRECLDWYLAEIDRDRRQIAKCYWRSQGRILP